MTMYQERAKQLVVDFFNKNRDVTDSQPIEAKDVYVVWFTKTLGNWKALLSTTVSDGMYYEVTHNGAKRETYLDAYKKVQNVCVSDRPTPLRVRNKVDWTSYEALDNSMNTPEDMAEFMGQEVSFVKGLVGEDEWVLKNHAGETFAYSHPQFYNLFEVL